MLRIIISMLTLVFASGIQAGDQAPAVHDAIDKSVPVTTQEQTMQRRIYLQTSGNEMRCLYQPDIDPHCCSDDQQMSSETLVSCTAEQQHLQKKVQERKTLYIGLRRIGGYDDKTTAKIYCVFESDAHKKLLIDAKQHLGLDFGSALYPDCEGLSSKQISLLGSQ